MVLSWIQRSWRGGLERDLEGVVVIGVGVRTSVGTMEAATRLIVDWSYFPCVLKRFKCLPLVEEGVLRGVDVGSLRCRSALQSIFCRRGFI